MHHPLMTQHSTSQRLCTAASGELRTRGTEISEIKNFMRIDYFCCLSDINSTPKPSEKSLHFRMSILSFNGGCHIPSTMVPKQFKLFLVTVLCQSQYFSFSFGVEHKSRSNTISW